MEGFIVRSTIIIDPYFVESQTAGHQINSGKLFKDTTHFINKSSQNETAIKELNVSILTRCWNNSVEASKGNGMIRKPF